MTESSAHSVNVRYGFRDSLSKLPERASSEQKRSRGRPGLVQSVGTPLIHGVNTLAHSPLFFGLRKEDIARLNARCRWRKVRAGEFLLNGRADGCAVSVVTNGRVRAMRVVNGREIVLRDISEGAYFGDLIAFDGSPGLTQIVAITDAIVARMPLNEFREAIYQYASVCDRVLADLAGRLRALNDRVTEQVSLAAVDAYAPSC